MDGLITIDGLAERTQMSVEYWRKRVKARSIPMTRFGRSVRFTPAQVAQIIAGHACEPQATPTRDEVGDRRTRRQTRRNAA